MQNNSIDFAIITAYRKKKPNGIEYTKKEKIQLNRELRYELNKRKLGVYQLVGHWQECTDPSIDDWRKCPKG